MVFLHERVQPMHFLFFGFIFIGFVCIIRAFGTASSFYLGLYLNCWHDLHKVVVR